jgi:hypothetical protein
MQILQSHAEEAQDIISNKPPWLYTHICALVTSRPPMRVEISVAYNCDVDSNGR